MKKHSAVFAKLKSVLSRFYVKIKPVLISVILGLLFGFIIMFIFEPREAFQGLYRLLIGGFKDGFPGFILVLHKSAPIIFTGLAVSFAFRTGLFNIGAAGQFMMGALAAVLFASYVPLPSPLSWIFAALVGGLFGGLWGLLPGLLKATRNVNEVVSSIMMNYIGAYLASILLMSTVVNSFTGEALPIPSSYHLPRLFDSIALRNVNLFFIFAVLVAIIGHIILNKTVLGFQLRASGFSIDASRYAGMNTKKNIIVAMTISGVFAGLGGALFYLNDSRNLSSAVVIAAEGFTGISVALLGLGEPIGVIFAAIFLTNLTEGGFNLQGLTYANTLGDVLNALIIYFVSISLGLQLFIQQVKKKRALKKELGGDPK